MKRRTSCRTILALGMILLLSTATTACLLAVAGAGAYGGYKMGTDPRTVGEQIDDGVITSKVNAKLVEEPGVRSLNIDVDTRLGEVTLSGYVKTQDQAERVMDLAAGVHGVSKVINHLKIKP
jgi:hyperosmotically inducible protein